MEPLRVALVGYGLAGSTFHAPLMRSCGLQITSVVTGDDARGAQVRRDLPEATVLPEVSRLWERAEQHDLVVIATDNRSHAPLARAAVDHRLPVVVDKPLAVSAAEAAGVVTAARSAQVPLTVFQNRRWDSDQLTLRRLMGAGTMGQVLRYESRFERWRPVLDPAKWRESTPADEGGGLLLDLGSHLVDQALQLFGPVTSVYAEVTAHRGGADDDVFVALTHEAGTRSHLWAGAMTGAPGPRLRVLGSDAALVVSELDGQEQALRDGRLPVDDTWGREPAGGAVLRRGAQSEAVTSERGRWDLFYPGVAAMVRDGAPPPVDPHGAVETLVVLEAARASAASGVVVRMRLPEDPAPPRG